MVKGFFEKAPAPEEAVDPQQIVALILPHAGYPFSGQTAAAAVALLGKRQPAPKRIVILGPSHTSYFRGLALGRYSAYQTPLGDAPVDLPAAEKLWKSPLVNASEIPHLREHSVDVEIPLLQYAFGDRMPPILPIVVGEIGAGDYPALGVALRRVVDRDTVFVVSSDFTHYGPSYDYMPFPADEKAPKALKDLNDRAFQAIQSLDPAKFQDHLRQTGDTICGRNPITLLLTMLPPGTRAVRVRFDMSGALMPEPDYTNSVSYLAVAFTNPSGWPAAPSEPAAAPKDQPTTSTKEAPPAPPKEAALKPELTPEERTILVRLARAGVEAAVRRTEPPSLEPCRAYPALQEKRAAFVTLTENKELRGCIGSIMPRESLCESVRGNALNAALNDSRFPPVAEAELERLHVEISALTVPREIPSWRDIVIGRDGVILTLGAAQAVFLPQVAPEQGWGVEEMLAHLSQKAGLPSDAWKDPRARFLVFQAQVFGE
jgi:AmmeMemoRadiSam system protein B/AmmeMemoRadiSam system protein A